MNIHTALFVTQNSTSSHPVGGGSSGTGSRFTPSLPELECLSGRMPVPIKAALKELVEENYIEWNPNTPPETAVIIEGWERPDSRFKKRQIASQEIQWGMDGGNIDYWTMH
ncbi:hypothetical protein NSQ91_14290 [Paenibacillus sp. FSL R7-0048]|uniref:hypothetical protein n=2 Tax=Paenibacillus TaxID=44249 RepID=UPI0030F6DB5B